MKKIVLRKLSLDLQELVTDRMANDGCGPVAAVTAILHDAAIERMVEHDIAILKGSWQDNDEAGPSAVAVGYGQVQITIQAR